jgi:hypothetical protein
MRKDTTATTTGRQPCRLHLSSLRSLDGRSGTGMGGGSGTGKRGAMPIIMGPFGGTCGWGSLIDQCLRFGRTISHRTCTLICQRPKERREARR